MRHDSYSIQRSAVELAWASILGKTYDDQTAKAMQEVMPGYDLEDFAFSPLHKAVMEIGSNTVEKALQQTSHWNVDAQDAWGRTTLTWAARRGDFQAMTLLLHHHADPHMRDNNRGSCLYEAIRSGSPRCVRLLLKNGVDVDQRDSLGSTPLAFVASQNACAEMLDLLLEYNPQIDHQGSDGDSALLVALEYSRLETARTLILRGADIHLKERSGYNALSIAILFNAHDVIPLLLERRADHQGPIKQHGTLLHLVAETADVRTLGLLTGWLAKRDVRSKRGGDGKTAAEVGRSRNTEDVEWQNAFFAFMWSVDVAKAWGPRDEDEDGEDDVFVDALEGDLL